MRRPRVFTDQPLAAGERVDLAADAARHLVRVLRLRPGAEVVLFNGDGRDYPAVMLATGDRHACRLEIGEGTDPGTESPLNITLLQALCKGEKMDWVIQKATELGVNTVVPVTAARSDVKLDAARADMKLAHWRAVAVAACEQCGRAVVPAIPEPVDPGTAASGLAGDAARYVLHVAGGNAVRELPGDVHDTVIAVGPEGGWTDAEIGVLERAGFTRVRFGPRILRTETAGAAIVAALQGQRGDC